MSSATNKYELDSEVKLEIKVLQHFRVDPVFKIDGTFNGIEELCACAEVQVLFKRKIVRQCLKVGKTLGVGIYLRVKVVNYGVTKTRNKAMGPTKPIHPAQENRALFTISVIVFNKPRS